MNQNYFQLEKLANYIISRYLIMYNLLITYSLVMHLTQYIYTPTIK